MTFVLLAGKAVATAATVAKEALLIDRPAKIKIHSAMLLPQSLKMISSYCQQV